MTYTEPKWLQERFDLYNRTYFRGRLPRYRVKMSNDGLVGGAHGICDYKRSVIRLAGWMPVIVGQPTWQTPTFRAEIAHLTVNPDWGIPEKIAKLEYLPQAHRDANYLRNQGIVAEGGSGRSSSRCTHFESSGARTCVSKPSSGRWVASLSGRCTPPPPAGGK